MKGFFSGSQLAQVKAPPSLIPKCGACGLYKKCQSPKLETYGAGKRKILIVGSYPGPSDDVAGSYLTGKLRAYLRKVLSRHGINVDRDCWFDAALICNPKDTKVTAKHVEYCRPNIVQRIKKLQPNVILLLGGDAVKSVIGWLWKNNSGSIDQWTGWQIPCQSLNTWVVPTYNPLLALNDAEARNPIPQLMFERHVQQAVDLCDSRPWDVVPDWRKDVSLIYDTDKAASILRKMIRKGGSVAFDYEANMLKPEGDGFKIVSCAVCWNDRKTIAYPWHGEAVKATIELFKSPLPKIAANLKYEDRVTRRILKTNIRNWYFDTMIGAHAIDNRPGTKSLKFQAFVHLGMESYNDHIEPFFKSDGTMTPNKISDVGLSDLLLYNGLDALLEYKLAQKQMEVLKYPKPEGMS